MARTRPPDPAPRPPTGFLASAVKLPAASRNMAGRAEDWQNQAWNFWETTGSGAADLGRITEHLASVAHIAAKRMDPG